MNILENKKDVLEVFTKHLREDTPFCFTKFGDSELFCIDKKEGSGGEHYYSREAARDLVRAYKFLRDKAFLGHWTWNAQAEKDRLHTQFGGITYPVFYDAILFHENEWLTPELKEFYKAIQESKRHKIYIAGPQLAKGQDFLKADIYIEVPQRDAYREVDRIINDVMYALDLKRSIVMTSCSLVAKIVAHRVTESDPESFMIDLGSALDPLFIGNTRGTGDNSEKACEFFNVKQP